MKTNPILSEFKAEIFKFELLEEQVNEIPESIIVGAIELFTGLCMFACHINTAFPSK